MKRNLRFSAILLVSILLIVQQVFTFQAPAKTVNRATDDEKITRLALLSDEITVRASDRSTSWLTLADGRKLLTSYVGPGQAVRALERNKARPLSLTWYGSKYSGEGNLVCGYASPSGDGIITLHRSNSGATVYAPNAGGEDLSSAPFVDYAQVYELPEPAEFLATGDFNADGREDLVAASLTGEALYLMRGSRHGLSSPTRIGLPGRVTAMVAGEINRADGLADLAVAIVGKNGPQLLVYEGPEGAFSREPEVLALPAEATSMAIALLDSSYEYDLAVAAGSELLIIHGRDRMLSMDTETRAKVQPAFVSREYFPFRIVAVAAGEFIREGYETDLAVLSENGRVQYLRRGYAETGGRGDWQALTEVALQGVTRASSSSLSMAKANLSALETDDLMVFDRAGNQMYIVSGGPGTKLPLHAITSLQTEGRTVAALPLRLPGSQPIGWAVLTSTESAPTLALTPADTTIMVTTNADNGNDDSPVRGGLRDAFITANNTPGTEPVFIEFQSDMSINPVFDLPKITRPNVRINTRDPKHVSIDGTRVEVGIYVTGGDGRINEIHISGARTGIKLEGGGRNRITGVDISAGTTGVQIVNSDMNVVIQEFIVLAFGPPNVITNNSFAGVHITGQSKDNVVLRGNISNNATGVLLDQNASNNIIGAEFGGNAFLQNGTAVSIMGNATGNLVQENIIADSSKAGLLVTGEAAFNSLGTPGVGNTIVGSAENGILVNGQQAEGQKIQGNFIGIVPGNIVTPPPAKEGNGGDGARIEGASGTQFGGATKGAGNTVSMNAGNGLTVTRVTGSTWIQGNNFGTDITGTTTILNGMPTGNGGEGTSLVLNMIPEIIKIGGTDPYARNIFGGNADGMSIINSKNTTVQGNYFGTNPVGHNLGNKGAGVGVAGNSTNILIGGPQPNAFNVFGYNGVHLFITPGVSIQATANEFRGHHMENLAGPPTNVKAEVASAVSSDAGTAIQGLINGALPLQDFTVQIYWSPKDDFVCKALGGFALRANPSGVAAFTANFPSPLPTGSSISALISEQHRPLVFSDHVEVTGDTPKKAELELTKTGPETARCGEEITYTITVTNKGNAAAIDPVVLDMITPPECIEDISVAPSQGRHESFIFDVTSLGRINPGASATITVKVKLKEDCAGDVLQQAAVFGDDKDNLLEDTPDSSAQVTTKVECTRVTGIAEQGKHLIVAGSGFIKGDIVEINRTPAKKTKRISAEELLAKQGKKLLISCDPANRARINNIRVRRNGEIIASMDSPTCPPATDTTTNVTSSPNPAPAGQQITFTATVTPSGAVSAMPTGTVEFLNGSEVLASQSLNSGGQATFNISNLAAGTYVITAAYSGNINFNASVSSALTQAVTGTTISTTTMLVSNLNPSMMGQAIAFIATVTPQATGSGSPTGTVMFLNGTILLGTRGLNTSGQAGMTISSLSSGSHQITVVYEGDSKFTGSTSNVVNQVVNPATQ